MVTLKETCENHLSQFFAQKSQKFYAIMTTSKIAEGDRTKRHIFDLINFI